MLRGRSTIALLFGCQDGKRGHVWSVDWDRSGLVRQVTLPRIQSLGLSNYLTWLNEDFNEIPSSWFTNNQFDLMLCDLDREHIEFWKVLQKLDLAAHSGSKILMHNTITFPEVKHEIEIFLKGHPNYKYTEYFIKHGLGILIKM